jgi:hypothetical protein
MQGLIDRMNSVAKIFGYFAKSIVIMLGYIGFQLSRVNLSIFLYVLFNGRFSRLPVSASRATQFSIVVFSTPNTLAVSLIVCPSPL